MSTLNVRYSGGLTACVCVCWQLQYKTMTSAHTQMLHVPALCPVCVIKIKLYGHVYHLQRKRVTSNSHMNSTPSFYIHNLRPSYLKTLYIPCPPHNHFLESGLTACQSELWEYHLCCIHAQVTTCDLWIHTRP